MRLTPCVACSCASAIIFGFLHGVLPAQSHAVTIDWVTVGDPGNYSGPEIGTASGPVTYGAVSYSYQIGKYEVTNAQYTEFLNAKSASDPLSLYNTNMNSNASGGIIQSGSSGNFMYSVKPGYENQPVNYVSWYDAVRFANWMNNGQGNADTESGSYTLLGGTPTPTDPKLIVRNSGARIAITSNNEWYKAAYYDPTKPAGVGEPNYWIYPTQSDSIPLVSAPPSSTPNTANIYGTDFYGTSYGLGYALTPGVGSPPLATVNYLTDVGAYTNSVSHYGTFDQAGNVLEWSEELRMPGNVNAVRSILGGAFSNDEYSSRYFGSPAATASGNSISYGFRLVNLIVPDPPQPGDFDSDGDVDGADFVIWQTNAPALSGHSLATGDADGDGDVDAADFAIWQANFPHASGSGASTVPEPATWFLGLLSLCGLAKIKWTRLTRIEVWINRALRFASPLIALSLLLGAKTQAAGIDIDWVTVGDAGNFGGPETFGRSFGAVPYEYQIDKYEVTNNQYAQFLTWKAASDPYQLYNANMGSNVNGGILRDGVDGTYTYSVKPGYGNLPVVYVSWYDAARFANWMNNGEGDADTESGSYTLLPGTTPPVPANVNALISRNTGAKIALPSEDEWYKAAYYDPNKLGPGQPDYWTYATKSDTLPSSGPPATHPANAGNYFSSSTGYAVNGDTTTGPVPDGVLLLTEVGAYTQSASAYGTFDQLGLTWEWNEGYFEMAGSTAAARGTMGGSFSTPQGATQSPQSYLGYSASRSTVQNVETGFRIVSLVVPEAIPGDFDSDGDVDGADFVIWQTNFPATGGHSLTTGDSDADGDVDGADFVNWQGNFPYSPGAGIASVPEPSGLLLGLAAICAYLLFRRQRRFLPIVAAS